MTTGEKKISLSEFVLGSIGMLVIAVAIFLAGGLGLVFGLPYFIAGTVAGVVVSILIITGSFAGSTLVTCPECGTEQKVTKKVTAYQCTECGHRVAVKPMDIKGLYAYYPPMD